MIIPVSLAGLAEVVLVPVVMHWKGEEGGVTGAAIFNFLWYAVSISALIYLYRTTGKMSKSIADDYAGVQSKIEEYKRAASSEQEKANKALQEEKSLRSELDGLREKLEAQSKEMTAQQESSTAEFTRIAKELQDSQRHANELAESEADLKNLLHQTQQDAKQHDLVVSDLKGQIEEMRQSQESLQRSSSTLQEKIRNSESVQAKLEDELKGKTARELELDGKFAELRKDRDQKEVQIDALNREITDIEGRIEQLNDQLAQERSKISVRDEEIANLQSQVDALTEKCEALMIEKEEWSGSSMRLEELEAALMDSESMAGHLSESLSQLEVALEDRDREPPYVAKDHLEFSANHWGEDDAPEENKRHLVLNWHNRGARIYMIEVEAAENDEGGTELAADIETPFKVGRDSNTRVRIRPKSKSVKVLPRQLDVTIYYALHAYPIRLRIDRKTPRIDRLDLTEQDEAANA